MNSLLGTPPWYHGDGRKESVICELNKSSELRPADAETLPGAAQLSFADIMLLIICNLKYVNDIM
jgi:hypothetical protein